MDFAKRSVAARERDEKYDAWKALLSPERKAWETILEKNLGEFYLPIHKHDKMAGAPDAWDFVVDGPALPRVLLIGDSISRGYTLPVRRLLAGSANVHRAPENCGSTKNALKKLDLYLGLERWDVIYFNLGIHDQETPVEVYERNLEKIIIRLKLTGAALIWASSTPVTTHIAYSHFFRRESLRYFIRGEPIVIRNAAAARLAARHGIRSHDLHGYILPRLAEFQKPDDVHFTDAGYEFLGSKVAQEIDRVLPHRLSEATCVAA